MNHKKREILLDYIKEIKQTTAHNKDLQEHLGVKSYKTLERYLNELVEEDILVVNKEGRAYLYKIIDRDLLVEEVSQKDAYDMKVLLDYGTEYMDESTHKLLKKMFSSNDFIEGHLSIFEDISNGNMADIYNQLLDAIEHRRYTKLTFKPNNIFRDCKCVRILFLDNNWYVGYEYYSQQYKKRLFKLGRLSFLKEIEFLEDNKYSDKNRFQTKDIEQYINFLKNIQNSMTHFGKSKCIAKLKASSSVAQYFAKDMKKFLSSQQYRETLEDGSVIFTVEYTNNMEILPFIQRWIPSIKILEPQILVESYKKNLQNSLNQYS